MTAFLISAALLVSVAALIVRFVKSSGEERLQLKWCATAALVLAVVFVVTMWVDSRTLAYAIVTGLLVGVYTGLVLLATQVWWTGGSTAPGMTPIRPWLPSRLASRTP